jgi:hypothetical protein
MANLNPAPNIKTGGVDCRSRVPRFRLAWLVVSFWWALAADSGQTLKRISSHAKPNKRHSRFNKKNTSEKLNAFLNREYSDLRADIKSPNHNWICCQN